MNSNPGNSQRGSSVSLNNYQFDFGLGSTFSKSSSPNVSLNDKKQQPPPPKTPYSFSSSSKPTSKPSWTHQPSPTTAPRSGLPNPNPNSMVGDIFGKSWGSAAPSGQGSRLGIVEPNPNLFGDLLGSSLGQGKNSNVPLKNATPARNSYSMGNLADSLPKTGNSSKIGTWESAENLGNYSSVNNSNKGGNFSGSSMKTGAPMNSNKDPFGSLMDFGSKPKPPVNSSVNKNNSSDNSSFGAFQNAPKSSGSSFASSFSTSMNDKPNTMNASKSSGPTFASSFSPSMNDKPSTLNSDSFQKMEDLGGFGSLNQPPQSKVVDPLDMLFSSSSSSSAAAPAAVGAGSEPFSGVNDWNLGSEFGGNDDMGGTLELDGLPAPPAGVTASIAKEKGLDCHKQGQHADAIKWLSWAVVLMEKSGDASVEVLSCRASCYKEVGEYKKAVADCTKVLENDKTNVSVLLQRALLYESSEKYKLGAEDLRAVLKIDPSNRLAKGTIHRLAKLAD
ncbi:tetratricopeptide repeat (TPR)-like superfamily protein isoform X1 [Tasmannia lanceolata]|uniref:tetratricopeptide repeat (TPR)-like superfamily protein isoform X1 n=1 Tax=Tasmannia lanceolata TaxID=3420 RepID=UPI0040638B71